jgi:LmbE family N-acetylglucosaminyl deacetylase
VRSTQTATRLTRLLEDGTAGQNIRPDTANGTFRLYGTPFQPDDPQDSFDYRSILRDTSTVSDVQNETLTIYATQTNTYNTVNTPALGYFQQGNTGLSSFGP